ncbi:MAG: hypothetical protein ACOX5J_08480 [Candidatus Hydrogenedentales bacterium]|jgi:hypothetical protein
MSTRAKKVLLLAAILLASHLVAFGVGVWAQSWIQEEKDETYARYCMFMARLALEANTDPEEMQQWLVRAEVFAPNWYGPLVLLAKLYEREGWPELSLHYLQRAQSVIASHPHAEAEESWHDLIEPLGQQIHSKIDELERRVQSAEH